MKRTKNCHEARDGNPKKFQGVPPQPEKKGGGVPPPARKKYLYWGGVRNRGCIYHITSYVSSRLFLRLTRSLYPEWVLAALRRRRRSQREGKEKLCAKVFESPSLLSVEKEVQDYAKLGCILTACGGHGPLWDRTKRC